MSHVRGRASPLWPSKSGHALCKLDLSCSGRGEVHRLNNAVSLPRRAFTTRSSSRRGNSLISSSKVSTPGVSTASSGTRTMSVPSRSLASNAGSRGTRRHQRLSRRVPSKRTRFASSLALAPVGSNRASAARGRPPLADIPGFGGEQGELVTQIIGSDSTPSISIESVIPRGCFCVWRGH